MVSLSSQLRVWTDEPKWSSASLSITLSHLDQIFRPEYTHQIVAGECWRGHRPLESVLREAIAEYKSSVNGEPNGSVESSAPACRTVLHKSHETHDAATNQLEIRVGLSPSCQKCRVDIKRTEINSGSDHGGIDSEGDPAAKRRKVEVGSEFERPKTLASSDSSLETNHQKNSTNLSSSVSISPSSMTDSEIIGALSKALPSIASDGDKSSETEDCFLSEPIGDVLEEYSIPAAEKALANLSAANDDKKPFFKEFVLTMADGRLPYVSEYHRSVQKLALFYIENADNVDVANDGDGGFWKIIYIFQKHDDGYDENEKKRYRYSLVGYFTLFHFIALFHKPEPGLIVRVCQALILPPFQGQGHGRRLLQAVYDLAHKRIAQKRSIKGGAQYDNIIQVNVEDPAPAFIALRNRIDFKLVLEHYVEWKWPESGALWSSTLPKSLASKGELSPFFSAMTEKEASEMSKKTKITPKQMHVANELLKLKAIHTIAKQERDRITTTDMDTIERLFRLMVKRRLNKEHRDELLEQPTKDDQKALLAKLFDKELKGYKRILSKLST